MNANWRQIWWYYHQKWGRTNIIGICIEAINDFQPGINEQTEIAEALLIDYFKTSLYNTHFTNGLSSKLKTLKNVYKLDFDAIIVEINNENIGNLKVFSNHVAPDYYHQAILDIRKHEGRISLLNLKWVLSG